jgi:hypothetical protein
VQSVLIISRALIYELENDLQSAVEYGQKGLDLARMVQSPVSVVILFIILGRLKYQLGEIQSAYHLVREGLEILKEATEFRENVVIVFCHLGGFFLELNAKLAVQMLAQSESLALSLPVPRDPTLDKIYFDRFLATSSEKLSETEFASVWKAGLKMTVEEAIKLGLGTLEEMQNG